MKRIVLFFVCFTLLLFWSSCRNDFEFSPSTGNLQFERDTVYLDTIFANIGSSTYNLKVYNRTNTDIVIPSIRLQNGSNSFYRLNVDGSTGDPTNIGKRFQNVELLANDSLYVFIETTFNTNTTALPDNEFLYTDKIIFDSGDNQQDVDLVTLIKDAIFIFPERNNGVIETLSFDADGDGTIDNTDLQGRFLNPNELTFTNQKPYVIYGYAAVNSGETLTIESGARVHFHAESGLLITNNASLQVNGALSTNSETLNNQVVFESDRLEPSFENIPGQWGTIWLFNGSVNNRINYATIKNATIGVLAEGNANATTPKLTITNTQIYNTSAFGVLGRATSITAENVVINNSGQSSFAGTFGGNYNITHSTIANYWTNSFREFPALLINDFIVNADNTITTNALNAANITNSIIYGNDTTEFLIDTQSNNANYNFSNNLIRFDNSTLENTGNYIFTDTNVYQDNVFNGLPEFKNPEDNQFEILETSAANGIGNTQIAPLFTTDILGTLRNTSTPDSGAYNSIVSFED